MKLSLTFLSAMLVVVVSGAIALTPAAGPASAEGNSYTVTIENLTDGQPFTPPVLWVRLTGSEVRGVNGDTANNRLQELAENGNPAPLLAAHAANPNVGSVVQSGAPLLPGESVTLTIEAPEGAVFRWASMLICTNDGFTGGPLAVTEGTVTFDAYDAGTELNTQHFADLVPPCQPLSGVSTSYDGTGTSDPALAEGGVVHLHEGIVADTGHLTDIHAWTGPVASVTVAKVADGAGAADAPKVTPPSTGSGGLLDANGNALAGLAALAAVMLFATGATLRLASRKA